jgi:transposase-like protein
LLKLQFSREDRMNVHKNARLTPRSRAELVRRVLNERQPPVAVAWAMGVSQCTVRKWAKRFQAEGVEPPGRIDLLSQI